MRPCHNCGHCEMCALAEHPDLLIQNSNLRIENERLRRHIEDLKGVEESLAHSAYRTMHLRISRQRQALRHGDEAYRDVLVQRDRAAKRVLELLLKVTELVKERDALAGHLARVQETWARRPSLQGVPQAWWDFARNVMDAALRDPTPSDPAPASEPKQNGETT